MYEILLQDRRLRRNEIVGSAVPLKTALGLGETARGPFGSTAGCQPAQAIAKPLGGRDSGHTSAYKSFYPQMVRPSIASMVGRSGLGMRRFCPAVPRAEPLAHPQPKT